MYQECCSQNLLDCLKIILNIFVLKEIQKENCNDGISHFNL